MMGRFRQVAFATAFGSWAAMVIVSYAEAETNSDATRWTVRSTRDYWEQQVLRRSQPGPAASGPRTAASRSPARAAQTWAPVRTVSEPVPAEPAPPQPMPAEAGVSEPIPAEPGPPELPDAGLSLGEMETVPSGEPFAPLPDEDPYYSPETNALGAEGYGPGCPSCGQDWGECSSGWCYEGSACGQCYGGGYWGFRALCHDWWRRHCWWVRNLSLVAGVNWGAPLVGPLGIGYQLGLQVAHSNFSGDRASSSLATADRNQFFFTGGVFRRRPAGGLQWGVVFDLLEDHYHGTASIRQIRSETSLVFSGCREIGYSGAYGINNDVFTYENVQRRLTEPFEATDTCSLFYRRHFSGGGQGRLWTGVSGEGDALIGADCTVPLGTSWALENNFVYLIPKEGHGNQGQQEETWSVSFQLVWYPGREAACVLSSPFHPLLSVADNSQFLLNAR
jgi:hypothetical protein